MSELHGNALEHWNDSVMDEPSAESDICPSDNCWDPGSGEHSDPECPGHGAYDNDEYP